MTDAQKKALKHLGEAGGSGVLDKRGKLMAAGEYSKCDGTTYMRLLAAGLVEGGEGRIRLTLSGEAAYREIAA